jgi:hypothetical protein
VKEIPCPLPGTGWVSFNASTKFRRVFPAIFGSAAVRHEMTIVIRYYNFLKIFDKSAENPVRTNSDPCPSQDAQDPFLFSV